MTTRANARARTTRDAARRSIPAANQNDVLNRSDYRTAHGSPARGEG